MAGKNIPQWQPSIFSSYLPYILAELDYRTNFTGIYNDKAATGTRDYYYFCTADALGFSEYFRYRYPAAQGTFVTTEMHETVDEKIIYQRVDENMPIYEIGSLANVVMPKFSCFIMLQNSEDSSLWAACLRMSTRIFSQENNFLAMLPADREFAEKIYALTQDIFAQVHVVAPLFSTKTWLVAQGVGARREAALAKIADTSNVDFRQFVGIPLPDILPQVEYDQVLLTTRWRIPGPLDLRYQPACPTSIRLRRRG